MRYVQLRAFHHVAITGGFSRAAEALFLTQPAISDQVRKLEEDYDIVLFYRRKRQVELTDAGRALLEITRRMFDSEQQAYELLSESRALRSGTLRIVADSAHHLLHLLPRFRAAYPGVRVSIRAGNTQTVTDSIYRYEADLGVLGEYPQSRDFNVLLLSSAPIVAFVEASHPCAQLGHVTLQDLAQMPLVMREQGSRTRRKLEEAARQAGVTLIPAIEAEGREAVREIVASGGGVGFVSEAEFGHDPRLQRIKIIGANISGMDETLICLRERGNSKLVQAFFNLAHSAGPH